MTRDDGHAQAWPINPCYPAGAFRGTARYYRLYRPRYPPEVMADLCARARVTGTGRLLDLACGTGEVALALHRHFARVWALDLEPEMVQAGREQARLDGIGNVSWTVGRAEQVRAPSGFFELVTAGNAFHRLDRPLIAARAMEWLPPGRCLAVLGTSSLWTGTQDWQAVAAEVIGKWQNAGRGAAPVAAGGPPGVRDEECLRAAGFDDVTKYRFPRPYRWTLDTLIGYLRSTSVGAQLARAGTAGPCEAELRAALRGCDPSGRYSETISFYYQLAVRPAAAA